MAVCIAGDHLIQTAIAVCPHRSRFDRIVPDSIHPRAIILVAISPKQFQLAVGMQEGN